MYRQIHTSIYGEAWFLALSEQANHLILALISHPLTDCCGFNSASFPRLVHDTKIPEALLLPALKELEGKGKISLLLTEGLIFLSRFTRWQGKGPKIEIARRNQLSSLPPTARLLYLSFHDTPSDTLPDTLLRSGDGSGIAQSVTVTVTDTVNSNTPHPPTPASLIEDSLGFDRISKTYETCWGIVSSIATEDLQALYNDRPDSFTEESWATMICEAIEVAHKYKKRSIPYIRKVLLNRLDKLPPKAPGHPLAAHPAGWVHPEKRKYNPRAR